MTGFGLSGISTPPSGSLDNAKQLTDAFGRMCPSQSVWTQNAVNAARSLEAMLDGIKDDPNCKSLSSALTSVRTLQTALDRHAQNQNAIAYVGMRRERHELLLQLQETTDPDVRNTLANRLRDTEIQLGSIEETNHYSDSRLTEALVTKQVVSSMQAVLSQSLAQEKCFLGKPQIFTDLAAVSGSIGAVVLSGGISLAVAAGVELIGSGVEYARKASLSRKIAKINQAAIHSSFTCALEALSNQWCSAQETTSLIRSRTESRRLEDDFSLGLNLLSREMPILMEWLDQVQSGTRPTNSAEAERQKDFYKKEQALKSFEASVYAILGEYKFRLPPEGDLEGRFKTLRNAIQNLFENVISRGPDHPIFEVIDAAEFGWRIAGIDKPPEYSADSGQSGYKDFFSYPIEAFKKEFPDVYPLEIDRIRENAEKLITASRTRLASERARIFQPNPRLILWDVETPTHSGMIRNVTPLSALRAIKSYLSAAIEGNLKAYSELSGNRKIVYEDTVTRLDEIEKAISAALVSVPRSTPPFNSSPMLDASKNNTIDQSKALATISYIYEIAQLEHGRTVMEGTLRRILRDRLSKWILDPSHQFADTSRSAQLLAAQDIIDEYRDLGQNSLINMQYDLSNASLITKNTTQGFAEVFSENLAKALEFYRVNSTATDTRLLTKMCLLLLAVPDWQSKELSRVPIKYCTGLTQPSIFQGGKPSLTIQESHYKFTDYSDRACQYRRFLRSERLEESFDRQPAP